jgi:hypothetical protein
MAAKIRAPNRKGNDVGMKRFDLYRNARSHLNKAFEAGYFIECIAICESIIADRLEARIAFIEHNDVGEHQFRTLRRCVSALRKIESLESPVRGLLEDVKLWEDERNFAVHEIVKLRVDKQDDSWNHRMSRIEAAAQAGIDLSKRVSAAVKKVNKIKIIGVY